MKYTKTPFQVGVVVGALALLGCSDAASDPSSNAGGQGGSAQGGSSQGGSAQGGSSQGGSGAQGGAGATGGSAGAGGTSGGGGSAGASCTYSGAYPAGPYAGPGTFNLGDVVPDRMLEGYVNPSAVGLANTQPLTTYSFDQLRKEGVCYAVVHISENF